MGANKIYNLLSIIFFIFVLTNLSTYFFREKALISIFMFLIAGIFFMFLGRNRKKKIITKHLLVDYPTFKMKRKK